MKRGLGLRKEPILWNSVGKPGTKPRVISPGEGRLLLWTKRFQLPTERAYPRAAAFRLSGFLKTTISGNI